MPDDRDDPVVAEAAEVTLSLGRVLRLLRRAGSHTDLSPGAASALATIVAAGPVRLGEVAAREQLAAPTVSRIVTVLENAGYVTRAADPSDGRAMLLAATEAGSELVSGVRSARSQAMAGMLRLLEPADRDGLLTGLRALEAVMTEDAASGE